MDKIENQELIDKAKELEINVDDFESEDDLQEAIDTKLKDESLDADELREKLEFQKEQAKKAYAARDKAKKDTRKIKAKMTEHEKTIEEMQKKLEAAPDMEEFKKLQKEMSEIQKAKEEKELEKMDEAQKAEIRFNKKMEEFNKKLEATESSFTKKLEETEGALEKSQKEVTQLRKVRLESEILAEAAKLDAYNPGQIAKLLSGEFNYDKDLETYTAVVRDDKNKIVDELSVKEKVKQFLEDPDNDNLVRSKAKGGTGSKETGTGSSNAAGETKDDLNQLKLGGKNRKSKDGKYDPKDKDLIAEADIKGLSVEDHIAILEMRDAKMNKIKGIKEGE